jgi:CheY-like chemotaxis protein
MATILYVEDHIPAQLLMNAIINEMSDYQLRLASSGQEACQITAQHPPDLYILDLDLPDTDGLSLAKELLKIHTAPVILVSAYAEAATIDESITFYLAKPLDPDHVATTIRRALT